MSILLTLNDTRFLLDRVRDAEAAYALHRLSRFQNAAIRVRRSSDNAEADVYFDGRRVTLNSQVSAGGDFGTWVGAGSAFVTTWYDQSGKGRNATQATAAAQPRIVNAGALDVDGNGRAQMVFDGTDDSLTLVSSPISATAAFTILAVAAASLLTRSSFLLAKDHDTLGRDYAAGISYVSPNNVGPYLETNGAVRFDATTLTADVRYLFGWRFDAGVTASGYRNGSLADTGTPTAGSASTTETTVGRRTYTGSQQHYAGVMQSVVVYARDIDAQRSLAEQELNRMLEIY